MGLMVGVGIFPLVIFFQEKQIGARSITLYSGPFTSRKLFFYKSE